MRHYCTLFDSKYLPQGLALYESLKRHSSEPFRLTVLPLDLDCEQTLRAMELQHVEVTSFGIWDLTADKLGLKKWRTYQEYCWTCASVFTGLLQEILAVDITYLDADLMFFSDPKVVFDEIGDRSIAVIPHRLSENKDKARLSKNGKFNVSWVTLKNTPVGRECLSTWAAQCRERCSAEVGCGDQGYLDEWPEKYGDDLCVIQNIGAGVAPWNLSSYRLGELHFLEKPTEVFVNDKQVVFYHFHEYQHDKRLTNYPLREEDKRLIYAPYIAACIDACKRIQSVSVQA